MERETVESSNLKSVGYDVKNFMLEIEFHNGSVYQYMDVPAVVHASLITAESVGKAFHKLVRNGGYEFKRVDSRAVK